MNSPRCFRPFLFAKRWLSKFCLVLLAITLAPALVVAAPRNAMGTEDARHLLTRTGFGAAPEEIAATARLSRRTAVDKLLAATTSEPLSPPPAALLDYQPPGRFKNLSEEEKKEAQRQQRQDGVALRAWWVSQMLGTPSPLTEHMTLFWHNHFVSSIDKVKSPALMAEQNLLLRRMALGNFGEMLHAVAKDPAMLVYLDTATSRKGQPNENFAREVMELFTLGEGHYSEQDIKEAARAYTGWSIEPETGRFKWRNPAHDDGVKTVLGHSGNFDGDDVLDILLAQPETAEFITAKLWKEFVSPTPDPREVRRIARRFRDSNYDIKTALRELFLSPAFWAKENRAALVKSPVDWVVGTCRSLELTDMPALPLTLVLRQLGQDLFAPPNVKGWPGGDAWINSNSLLARKQFADRMLRAEPQRLLARMRNADDGADLQRRMEQAVEDLRFDTGRWQRDLYLSRLTPAAVLLPLPPSVPAGGDMSMGEPAMGEQVKTLLMDPVSQLK
jgi:uncharacterized protein (DUF1800 family)